ncbi:hypothetical protein MPH_05687, partial [Macrophomina phaseolina MS6]
EDDDHEQIGEQTEALVKEIVIPDVPGQEAPVEGTPANPLDINAASASQAERIVELEQQVEYLRFQNAQLAARGPWPNLSHIPPIPSHSAEEDPTGFFEEKDISFMLRNVVRHSEEDSAVEENMMDEAWNIIAQWDRMLFGPIEARDEKEVLDHDGGIWEFVKILGAGGCGKVSLWQKVSQTTRVVIDRVAVKEEESRSSKDWCDPLAWRDGLPIEISIHTQIQKIQPPCPHLLGLRGYRINLKQRRHRLYLPYQGGGDLSNLMNLWEDFQNISEAPPEAPSEAAPGPQRHYVPPLGFIWYTFLAMAEACLALDSGWWGDREPSVAEKTENECRKEGWIPIIHRDIKPANTFMGAPGHDAQVRWSMYPTPVMGDLGLCFEAYPGDPHNPDNYVDYGTYLYMAPEQLPHRPFGSFTAREFSDRTNVFGIAATIFHMWQGRAPGFHAKYGASDDPEDSLEADDVVEASPVSMGVLPLSPFNARETRDLIYRHYQAHPPRTKHGREIVDNAELKSRQNEWMGRINRKVGGDPYKIHWVYLYELESWKPHWLLRYLTEPDENHGPTDYESMEQRKLAKILRECLTWDADARPSILKLRGMIKTAIDELDIKPDSGVEYLDDPRTEAPNLYQKLRLAGGLLYFTGEIDPGQTAERSTEILRKYPKKARVRKAQVLEELVRRVLLKRFRPVKSSDFQEQDGSDSQSQDGGGEGQAQSDVAGGRGNSKKRQASDDGNPPMAKRVLGSRSPESVKLIEGEAIIEPTT